MGLLETFMQTSAQERAGRQASEASERAALIASEAAMRTMQAQLAEIQRQYNDQRELLGPMLQRQYDAGSALSDLLGITGAGPDVPTPAPPEQFPLTGAQQAGQDFQSDADQLGGAVGDFVDGLGQGGQAPSDPLGTGQLGGLRDAFSGALGGGGDPATGTTSSGLQAAAPAPSGVAGPFGAPVGQGSQLGILGGAADALAASGQAGPGGLNQLTGKGAPTPGSSAPIAVDFRNPFGGGGAPPAPPPPPPSGPYQDPNLDNRQFGQSNFRDTALGRQVTGRRLAGDDASQDVAMQHVAGTGVFDGVAQDSLVQHVGANPLAGASLADDEVYQSIFGRQRTGDSFETSPGYAFAREEMQRGLERQASIGGGNVSGAAMIEAQRRAQGLANQDYYNWMDRRMAEDRGLNAAAEAFSGRRQFDIARGDMAVGDARRREELDQARGDAAMQDFLNRRTGQIGREDAAVNENLRQQRLDQQIQQQNYLNRIAQLSAMAGVGSNSVGQAVDAAGRTGQSMAGIYGQAGNTLGQVGAQNALTQGQIAAGVTNAQGQAWANDSRNTLSYLGLLAYI